MSKIIVFDDEATEKLKTGVTTLAQAVKVTMGPRGANVILKDGKKDPRVTKDGVTVAKEIELDDPIENLGAEVVREACELTNTENGDGTTTSAVLAEHLFVNGLAKISDKVNPIRLQSGMISASRLVRAELMDMKTPVKDEKELAQIATISANGNSEIGDMVAKAYYAVGKEGFVAVQENTGVKTELDIIEGMQIPVGFASPYFVNTESQEVRHEGVRVLVYDGDLDPTEGVIKLLEKLFQTDEGLMIVAHKFSPEVLALLVINKIKSAKKLVAVRAPGQGDHRTELLKDLALVTGQSVSTSPSNLDIKTVQLSELGFVSRVTVSATKTTILSGNMGPDQKQKIVERIEDLDKMAENAPSDFMKNLYTNRKKNLEGKAAIISVGAQSEIEMKELYDRVEDAVNATREAFHEGFVPGGGKALIQASKVLEELPWDDKEKLAGADLVRRALYAPLECIITNAGVEDIEEVTERVYSDKEGYDALHRCYGDMRELGIVDPVSVTISAVMNAVSVASTLLTTKAVVVRPETKQEDMLNDLMRG